MTDLKITQGDWEAKKAKGADWYEIHYSKDGECVAEVVHSEADAKLIAAAPDLLEALIVLINADPINVHEYFAAEQKAYTAIAKATK